MWSPGGTASSAAIQAPRLEAEAFMHALGSWLIAAPQGLTFVRPVGGPVQVSGKMVRASLTNLDKRPPNFSFEGVKLVFTPQPGAQPFALANADRFEFHLRAGPDDEGGVFAELKNGKAQLSGLMARIAGDKPISLTWNSTLSKMSAFSGADWPDAIRKWTAAGGQMTVRNAGLTAGDALIGVRTGRLGVGVDGRLTGSMEVNLREAPRAIGVMGEQGLIPQPNADAAMAVAQARQAGAEAAQATITFQAGQTTLGPVAVGPAPRVYEVR
jgi:hypothetical protein